MSRKLQPASQTSQEPPHWLFSNNSTAPSAQFGSNDLPSATMAKKDKKTKKEVADSTSASSAPPAQLMDLVETFLSDQGFDNAHREFQKHRAKKGWKSTHTGKSKAKEHHSLASVFQTWETFTSKDTTPVTVTQTVTKVSSSDSDSDSDSGSDDSSSSESSDSDSDDVAMADAPAADESSSDSSDSSDSSSESEGEDEKVVAPAPTKKAAATVNPKKRKVESDSSSSSSSSSDEDMADSTAANKKPLAKKAKTSDSSDESSSSSSSSESSDESSEEEIEKTTKGKKQVEADSDSSESSSDSESSESDSESEDEVEVAAKVALPDSDSSSSESESDDEKPKTAVTGAGSDTSATLEKASPDFATLSTSAPLPPDPSLVSTNNRGKGGAKKTQNVPFSRIRKDVVVDPRLLSNAYVAHGYGERAHQDLIVTKGKGFTKEKNKKKRGAYKGGALDVHVTRSIKFDD
ncbi:SRP40, C-terminal domain-containing protein [Xylariaceae sp. FL0016]|nr:SRP40, C-terminal domain-containing protein [Xylariaceae sp. FL0016]